MSNFIFLKSPKVKRSLVMCLMVFLKVLPIQAQVCQPKNYPELLKCGTEQSYELIITEQQMKTAVHLEGIANQRLNPDLEAESVYKGSNKSETSAALLFTVPLGGKRNAAVTEAKSEVSRLKVNADLSLAQNKLGLILKLYRLRQLENELKIEEEAVTTFTKIVAQFQKKAALSPEQEVSLSIFRMATTYHQLTLSRLKAEQEKLFEDLLASNQLTREIVVRNLPALRIEWPQVTGVNQVDSSPHIRVAQSDLAVAKSLKEKADANAWPDLKVGPSIKMLKDGSQNENYFGLALSIPIPILSVNESGRAFGSQKIVEAELQLIQTKRKVNALREQLVRKYQSTVSALQAAISNKNVVEKHEQIERHFFKGLVPSSLVIEAHRQLIDLETKRNESEREAIESLGSIYIIDNQFSEVIL